MHVAHTTTIVRTRVLALAIPLAAVAASSAACSSKSTDAKRAVASTTAAASAEIELYVARVSLGEIGADVPGSSGRCAGCHSLTAAQLREWGTSMRAANTCMNAATGAAKIDCLRSDPTDSTSPFSPAQIGLFAAGAHTNYFAGVFKKALPADTWEAELKKFQSQAGMPRGDRTRMSEEGFYRVGQWVGVFKEKPTDPDPPMMPRLDEVLAEEKPPAACTDSYSTELKAHVTDMIANGWMARNIENALPMFACPVTATSPLDCFQQTDIDGSDLFPTSDTQTFSDTWAYQEAVSPLGHQIRILRTLSKGSYFWTRSSADGRFVANGLYSDPGGRVVDLQAELAGLHRDIATTADYDPAFFPDNSGFMFHGVPVRVTTGTTTRIVPYAAICQQSLLSDPTTTSVTFREPSCKLDPNVGQYESVGSGLDGGDGFVVFSDFMNDDRGRAIETGRDPFTYFGKKSAVAIAPVINSGTGFTIGTAVNNTTEFEGDAVVSPSAKLLVTRVAGPTGQLGYAFHLVKATKSGASYTITVPNAGRICNLKGAKPVISYDERVMTLHHYVDKNDWAELGYASATDAGFVDLLAKGASNIYIVDISTGAKTRLTTMKPGQYALYPHFRSDGWLYFLVRDVRAAPAPSTEYIAASDALIRYPLPVDPGP